MPGPMSAPNGNPELLSLRAYVEWDHDRRCDRKVSVAEQRQRLLMKKKLDTGKTAKKKRV